MAVTAQSLREAGNASEFRVEPVVSPVAPTAPVPNAASQDEIERLKGSFLVSLNRPDFEQAIEHSGRIAMNITHRRPDLGVGVFAGAVVIEAAKDQGRQVMIVVTNETLSTKKLLDEYPPNQFGYTLRTLPKSDAFLTIAVA